MAAENEYVPMSLFTWIVTGFGALLVTLVGYGLRIMFAHSADRQELIDHMEADERQFNELKEDISNLSETQKEMHRENREMQETLRREAREDRNQIEVTIVSNIDRLIGRLEGKK